MKDVLYSRVEVLAMGNRLPERGLLCHCCRAYIPQFADLSEADERRVRHLSLHGRPRMAAAELRAATGCSLLWAEVWVAHGGRPKPSGEETPCPSCGKPLRTSLAKQCRFCHSDWHNAL